MTVNTLAGWRYGVKRAVALVAALISYSFKSVLMNWSAQPSVQPDLSIKMDLPPWSEIPGGQCRPGCFGFTFTDAEISVDSKAPDSSFCPKGSILVGDHVRRVEQAGQTIYSAPEMRRLAESWDDVERLRAVQLGQNVTSFLDMSSPCEVRAASPIFDAHLPVTVVFDLSSNGQISFNGGHQYSLFWANFFIRPIGLLLAIVILLFRDPPSLCLMVSKSTLQLVFAPAVLWTMKDLCEMLSSSILDPTTFMMIQQVRLIGTAVCMYLVFGTSQTHLQMTTLFSITLAILVYCEVPLSVTGGQEWYGFGSPKEPFKGSTTSVQPPLGILYALLAVSTSVLAGVFGQRAVQDQSLAKAPLALFLGSIQLVQLVVTAIILPFIGWPYGPFGAEDAKWWHCRLGESQESCQSGEPVQTFARGFDYRTWVVICFFVLSEFATLGITRLFDSLTKNLVTTSALTFVYFIDLFWKGRSFNFTQCATVFLISILVLNYNLVPKPVASAAGKPAAKEEDSDSEAGDTSQSNDEDADDEDVALPRSIRAQTAPPDFFYV